MRSHRPLSSPTAAGSSTPHSPPLAVAPPAEDHRAAMRTAVRHARRDRGLCVRLRHRTRSGAGTRQMQSLRYPPEHKRIPYSSTLLYCVVQAARFDPSARPRFDTAARQVRITTLRVNPQGHCQNNS